MVTITTDTYEEFEGMVENHDIRIASPIVSTILRNINGRKRYVHVLDVFIKEDQSTHYITADRNEFIATLKSNIKTLEENEMFEECAASVKAITLLEENIKKIPPQTQNRI
jgi:hypothetical protein